MNVLLPAVFYFLYGALAAHNHSKAHRALPSTDSKVLPGVDSNRGGFYETVTGELAMTQSGAAVPTRTASPLSQKDAVVAIKDRE